jgi:hypothetical protein
MGPTIDAPREFLLRAIAGNGLSETPCLDRNKCAASGVNRLRHHGKTAMRPKAAPATRTLLWITISPNIPYSGA